MRCASKTGILKECLRSIVENDLFITLREAKATIAAIMSASLSQQLVQVVLKTFGYSRRKRDLVHARASSTEIATTVFLELRGRCEAPGRWFVF